MINSIHNMWMHHPFCQCKCIVVTVPITVITAVSTCLNLVYVTQQATPHVSHMFAVCVNYGKEQPFLSNVFHWCNHPMLASTVSALSTTLDNPIWFPFQHGIDIYRKPSPKRSGSICTRPSWSYQALLTHWNASSSWYEDALSVKPQNQCSIQAMINWTQILANKDVSRFVFCLFWCLYGAD